MLFLKNTIAQAAKGVTKKIAPDSPMFRAIDKRISNARQCAMECASSTDIRVTQALSPWAVSIVFFFVALFCRKSKFKTWYAFKTRVHHLYCRDSREMSILALLCNHGVVSKKEKKVFLHQSCALATDKVLACRYRCRCRISSFFPSSVPRALLFHPPLPPSCLFLFTSSWWY